MGRIIEGLLKKGCWSFRQFGAALKHQDYRTVVVNEDFIINLHKILSSPNNKAKALVLNYPNNPTTRIATLDFFHGTKFNYFWHQNDDYTLTSQGQQYSRYLEGSHGQLKKFLQQLR